MKILITNAWYQATTGYITHMFQETIECKRYSVRSVNNATTPFEVTIEMEGYEVTKTVLNVIPLLNEQFS